MTDRANEWQHLREKQNRADAYFFLLMQIAGGPLRDERLQVLRVVFQSLEQIVRQIVTVMIVGQDIRNSPYKS